MSVTYKVTSDGGKAGEWRFIISETQGGDSVQFYVSKAATQAEAEQQAIAYTMELEAVASVSKTSSGPIDGTIIIQNQ